MLKQYRDNCEKLYKVTPEQFARSHNLMLENDTQRDECAAVAVTTDCAMFYQKAPSASLFSVNLGFF